MLFGWSLATTVGATYMFLQCVVLVALSVTGFCFVQKQYQLYKEQLPPHSPRSVSSNPDDTTQNEMINVVTNRKKKSFCKEWVKTVWKMRSVYSSFLVHSFDIATDLIVILDWFNESDQEHIDSKLMAFLSIGVIAFHKIISAFAIWIVEKNLLRTMLQLFDFLVYQEIYYAHNKIVASLKNSKKGNATSQQDAIESTMTFKYIRSLEATYESMPQAVLQLIYLMRTAAFGESNSVIIGLSILQSLISMTNSILKDDNSRGMQGGKWKKHKKRLPPSIPFLKHGLSRASQVISRVAILSLFWTVVGGLAFGFMALFELLCLLGASYVVMSKITSFSIENTFLLISGLILLPPELMFSDSFEKHGMSNLDLFLPCSNSSGFDENSDICIIFCINYFACVGLGKLLSNLWFCCSNGTNQNEYVWPSARLGISFIEITIIIIVGALNVNNPNEVNYLFDIKHGLMVFIVMIVSYLIDCGYLLLFPTFSLPLSANPRSKWGFAMAGELTQMQKLSVIELTTKPKKEDRIGTITHTTHAESQGLTLAVDSNTNNNEQNRKEEEATEAYAQQIITSFWDEPCSKASFNDENEQAKTLIEEFFDAATGHDDIRKKFIAQVTAAINSPQQNYVLSHFPINFNVAALAYRGDKCKVRLSPELFVTRGNGKIIVGARDDVLKQNKNLAKKILELQWIDIDLIHKIPKKRQNALVKHFLQLCLNKNLFTIDSYRVDIDILRRNDVLPLTVATFALANNQMEIVKWLESVGAEKHKMYDNNVDLAREAIWNGDLPLLENSIWKLAYDGKLDELKNNELFRNASGLDDTFYSGDGMLISNYSAFTCANLAASRDHWHVVAWLKLQGAKENLKDMDAAIRASRMDYYIDYKDDFPYFQAKNNDDNSEYDNKDELNDSINNNNKNKDDISNYIDISKVEKYSLCYHGDLETLKLKYSDYEGNEAFWNEPFIPWKFYPVTLAVYACVSKSQLTDNVLAWVEKHGARKHGYLYGCGFGGEVHKKLVNKIKPFLRKDASYEEWENARRGQTEKIQELIHWDDEFDRREYMNSFEATSAMFALANKQYDIVDWLESQGAKKHLFLNRNVKYAREIIDPFYDAWID